jgi:hypothetical protein
VKTIENFSHPNRARLTPHTGPTRRMFLGVDRVEGQYQKIVIQRLFLPKTKFFSHPTHAYPPAYTRFGPTPTHPSYPDADVARSPRNCSSSAP